MQTHKDTMSLEAKLWHVRCNDNVALHTESLLIIVATDYIPYDTYQTILAGIKSPDPRHG